ncbi:MAG: hypothetical protein GX946_06915 [Oligosphaeraceae bacterium]|nr:hypothetical protein [Oligosphaeraceae bacterium]
MSVREFRDEYFNALLNLIWRQWTRLGISGQIASDDSPYVVDPEALLLFSSSFCRYDQRLYDLVIDWLRVNGAFINVQRLKSLSCKVSQKDAASLGFIVATMSKLSSRKWKKLADDLLPVKRAEAVPMFIAPDQKPLDFCRQKDKIALQYGYLRMPYQPTNKVTVFPIGVSASILLQMRGVFGLSARAETILTLLNKDICKIQDVADISGFSWKSIQDTLMELTAGGLVATDAKTKRGRYYYLKSPDKIQHLFDVKHFFFPDWRRIFDSLGALWQAVANPRLIDLSEKTFHSEMARVFEEEIGEKLLDAGISELQFLNPEKVYSLPPLLEKL